MEVESWRWEVEVESWRWEVEVESWRWEVESWRWEVEVESWRWRWRMDGIAFYSPAAKRAASKMALDLLTVSRYSFAGSESATMPAPARIVRTP